ncbi:hypothetical protein IWQ61_008274 [Dispira simplex]|nr:hypothetical protein IWQ61_008274 [Dispira simplex]
MGHLSNTTTSAPLPVPAQRVATMTEPSLSMSIETGPPLGGLASGSYGVATAPTTRCSSPAFDGEEGEEGMCGLSDSNRDFPNNQPLFLNFTSDLSPFTATRKPKARRPNVYRVSGVNILNRNSIDSKTVMERIQRRRENHNYVERRRRDNINLTITELSQVLPDSFKQGIKLNKGSVLRLAVDYIREVQLENRMLRNELGLPEEPLTNAQRLTLATTSSDYISNTHTATSSRRSSPNLSPNSQELESGHTPQRCTVVHTSVSPSLTATTLPSANGYMSNSARSSRRPSTTAPAVSFVVPFDSPTTSKPNSVPPSRVSTGQHLPPFGAFSATMVETFDNRLRDTTTYNPAVVQTPLPSIPNTPVPSVPNSPGISPNRPIEELVLPCLNENKIFNAKPSALGVNHADPQVLGENGGSGNDTPNLPSTPKRISAGAVVGSPSSFPSMSTRGKVPVGQTGFVTPTSPSGGYTNGGGMGGSGYPHPVNTILVGHTTPLPSLLATLSHAAKLPQHHPLEVSLNPSVAVGSGGSSPYYQNNGGGAPLPQPNFSWQNSVSGSGGHLAPESMKGNPTNHNSLGQDPPLLASSSAYGGRRLSAGTPTSNPLTTSNVPINPDDVRYEPPRSATGFAAPYQMHPPAGLASMPGGSVRNPSGFTHY